MKTDIDIDWLLRLCDQRADVNSLKLEDIRWMREGKEVQIAPKLVEDFKFLGLNNVDFI